MINGRDIYLDNYRPAPWATIVGITQARSRTVCLEAGRITTEFNDACGARSCVATILTLERTSTAAGAGLRT